MHRCFKDVTDSFENPDRYMEDTGKYPVGKLNARFIHGDGSVTMLIGVNDDIRFERKKFDMKLSFCPMCGKKLTKEDLE